MRVLMVASFCDRSEVALVRGLADSGVHVERMCDPAAPERQELAESGIPVSTVEIRHRLDWRAVRRIHQRLVAEPFDILYAPGNASLSVSLLASRGLRLRRIGYRGTIGHLSRWDPASWLTYFNPTVDRIVCVSDAVRRHLLSLKLHPSRLTTIYKGHDPEWYAGLSAPGLSGFGIPRGAFVVGFCGNMRPIKGVDVLLRSAFHFAPFDPVHFLLLGQVRDVRVRRLARDERIGNRLHFAGFRKDAPALIGRCDVLVVPSRGREGLPRVAIEAMAQGVPAVVSDVGGMPELVEDGVSGFVVPAGDPAAIADAVKRLLADPQRRVQMGKRARERVAARFHIRETIRRTLELYSDLAEPIGPI